MKVETAVEDTARALEYVTAAERAAAEVEEVPEGTAMRPVRSVGVIGAGTMGLGSR